ncbi:CAAX prenyl protease 1 like protein [Trachymyrmex septentrionalis]|uniref:CAAX prenyl protease n=1 Tax=Trachymyrmex septentrionalis TaxID=34720 RepID=A0A195FC98_9HYME|nr:PREDICTED: CAAX prenyl protease 1 homolog [Trachymyrmex septentrionalis]XP_018344366.1 PREDICTED: CAAX prenyl protease 1 homolog [Trachymyrmex septentrionalis]KYN37827.1 CAAX prenyl protease 1 like protein [Trachymyrmex septentrionalis]
MEALVDFWEKHILETILWMIWLLNFWHYYLNFRQRALLQRLVDLPKSIEGLMSKDTYDKARAYALHRNTFGTVQDVYSKIYNTLILIFYAYYYFWQWSIKIAKYYDFDHKNEILISAICMFIIGIFSHISNLPIEIYDTFVLEQKHGFNKQTAMFFIKDEIKRFLVTQIITLPLLCGIIWVVQNGGDYFFWYLWLLTVVVSLFMIILYPEIIAPLFDKYTPLPEGELKQKIEELAASLKFPLYKLFVVEGSKRSSHSNAYLYGFYKYKRIVLFDTLIKDYCKKDSNDDDKEIGCETNEILAVLAHELGHWKHNHALLGFLLSQIILLANFIMFAKLLRYTPMYSAFGFVDSQPIIIGLFIVTMYILIPLNTIFNFIIVVISRRYEFQADHFATKLGHGEALKAALLKLQKDNLGYPLYDKLYSSWNHSHPPTIERLEAIDKTK